MPITKATRNVIEFSNATGIANTQVYISTRTDGVSGNGTINNPYDASTETKFDALIPTLPQNSTIVLLPGTYYTKYTTWPNFCSVIGEPF